MTLNEKLNYIRGVLDTEIPTEDIEGIITVGSDLSSVIGLSAECKAQAKKLLELSRCKAIIENDKDFTATILNKYIDSQCAEELAAYEYADRLNAAVTHKMDLVRSYLSFRKEEMSIEMRAGFQPGEIAHLNDEIK